MLGSEEKGNKMPYIVPEGYFQELEERLDAIPRMEARVSRYDRMKPYLALAAAFLFIVTGGTALLRLSAGRVGNSELSLADEMTLADMVPVTEPDMIYMSGDAGDGALREDITSYLIDSGTTLDYISYYEDNR